MSTSEVTSADVQRAVVDKIWLEGLNQGDLSIAEDYLTPDFRNHGSHDDSLTGPESFKLTIRKQRSGFSDIEYENWQRIIQVNLTGPFLCSQALVPQLAAKGSAAIVNTASTNGLVAEPRLAHYNTSKGGLVMLTKSMAIDLAPLGIRVNAVAPGVIATPLIEHILAAETSDHFGAIPAGRVGQPGEIAACIAFLASDEASYCHGTVLVCDGGQLAINGELPETAVTDAGPR